jgi:hypothetical protein
MGKGDWRRPTLEPDAKFTQSWCTSVGHKWSGDGEWCVNCGKTKLEVASHADAVGEPRL